MMVGVWPAKALRDIVSTPIADGPHMTPVFGPAGVPFLSVNNIVDNRLSFEDLRYISREDHLLFSRKCAPRRGDILMGKAASVGKVALVETDLEFNIWSPLAMIRVGRDSDPRYVCYQLQGDEVAAQIAVLTNTSSQGNIGMSDIGKIRVPLPPLDEQRRIADVLSSAEAFLLSIERLAAKKRAIRQGIAQNLLGGRTRLPGFTGDWSECLLGTLAKVKTGSRNNEDKDARGRYPFFVRSATVERIGTYSYDCEAILVPGEGGIGSIFHYINGKFEVHQRVYRISDFSDRVVGKYIYYFMQQFFGPHAMENSVKATVDSLRLPTFLNFRLLLPPTTEEQEAIARILADADAEIEALELRLSKAKDVRQGMMQELLTGRTRLVPQEVSA